MTRHFMLPYYILPSNIESGRIRVYVRIRPRTLEESKRQEDLGVESDKFEVSIKCVIDFIFVIGVWNNCVIKTCFFSRSSNDIKYCISVLSYRVLDELPKGTCVLSGTFVLKFYLQSKLLFWLRVENKMHVLCKTYIER